MRVLIVDDEALARQRVRRLLQQETDVELVGEAETGPQAVSMIRTLQPDLVCLDVQMPGLDGFGVLRALDGTPKPMVLFVTAYDEHAQQAFDVHAIDYVLKPVEPARFHAAFERARRAQSQAVAAERLGELLETVKRLTEVASEPTPGLLPTAPLMPATRDAMVPGAPSASRLLVKQDGRMVFVKTEDIDWIEADRNYVKVHVGATTHTIRERISHLEETLDRRIFARIHRSTLVNLNRVREMQPWFSGDYIVILADGTKLRLSRHYRDRVERQVAD